MPEFAKHIEVIRDGHSRFKLKVDGQDFPWFVGKTIRCEIQRGDMPSVTVELFADQVDIHDELAADGSCTCDGVNSGCSHPSCLSRGE